MFLTLFLSLKRILCPMRFLGQILLSLALGYSTLQASTVQSRSFFGKQLDSAILSQALPLSTEELLAYIESQGIRVYFLPLENRNYSKMEAKYLAPPEWILRYRSEYKRDGVLGAYISPILSPSETQIPIILLTDISNRWTILHEFLHVLFEREKTKNKLEDIQKVFERQQASREDFLDLYPKRSDLTRLPSLISTFRDYVLSEIILSKSVSLEEVTIELILLEFVKSGALQNIGTEQIQIAISYAGKNLAAFQSYLNNFKDTSVELEKLLHEAEQTGAPSEKMKQAKVDLNLVHQQLSEIQFELDHIVVKF